MLKIYMNEPFAHPHELAQAKRLVKILSDKHANGATAWLCLNFSFGGKSLDAAYITSDNFFVIELKSTGRFVSCGENLENCRWVSSDDGYSESERVIATPPYVNPLSQVKTYRIQVMSELNRLKAKFLKRTAFDDRNDIRFEKWVRGCVLLSQRDASASDVNLGYNEISPNVKKWFCYGTLGAVCTVTKNTLKADFEITSKEIEKLVTRVIGLCQVNDVLEHESPEPLTELPLVNDDSGKNNGDRIKTFLDRYGSRAISPPIVKNSKKEAIHDSPLEESNDFQEIELIRVEKRTDVASENEGCDIIASEKSFKCGFLKVTLSGEMMSVAQWHGSITELDGNEAVTAVKMSCPDIGAFEVSKVLRFGDGISADKKEKILAYFSQKYASSPQWNRIVYFNGGINFIFGKPRTSAHSDSSRAIPPGNTFPAIEIDCPISTDFFQPRWIRDFIDKSVEGLTLWSSMDSQPASELSHDDVRRYAKAYFSRSCAELFVVLDWVLGKERIESDFSVLDIGCGSGGATLGCLLAIHKHNGYAASSEKNAPTIHVDGVDVNGNAISFAQDIVELAQRELQGEEIKFTGFKTDFTNCDFSGRKYDIVIASKIIGEMVSLRETNAYLKFLELCVSRVSPRGVLLVIDRPQYECALQEALSRLKESGRNGWCKTMRITLDGGRDYEDFVCACLAAQTNNTEEKYVG